MENILEIRDLIVRFYTYEGIVKAIEGVNLDLKEGETLGLVGETGCGKSVTSLSTLVLVPPPGRIEGGKIFFKKGKKKINMVEQKEEILQKIRGKDISMIFQEPSAALDPVYTVGDQIAEVILHHRRMEMYKRALRRIEEKLKESENSAFKKWIYNFEHWIYKEIIKNPDSFKVKALSKIPIVRRYQNVVKKEVKQEVIRMLKEMEIADAERVVDMYPHELSGGMQQRAVIAMALACNPNLLIADEPTTSLDVTIQAQILNLIRELKRRFNASVLYITHDMGVVAEMCDRVAVMYAGTICEVANVIDIFKNPLHPYTKALIESIPEPGKEFKSIKGTVPSLINPPKGCRFHPRCPYAMDICTKVKPELVEVKSRHQVACHLYTGYAK